MSDNSLLYHHKHTRLERCCMNALNNFKLATVECYKTALSNYR